jgi:dihydroflavonol-4-reductase
MSTILVTGGTGFVGRHCILQLLRDGHEVRTTVRSLAGQTQMRAALKAHGVTGNAPLAFVAADLLSDQGWAEVASGCEAVLHVASPFPLTQPDDENEVILPARDGALRVLRASREAGVRRVVMTSSFAAVGYGRVYPGRPYDERDWTEEDAPNAPYIRSKVIAERAAWDFIAREGGALTLSVINPTGIFGPMIGANASASIAMVKAILEGHIPGPPDRTFGVVDVRDVADLHIRAMESAEAAGERFIAVSGPALSLREVAQILREHLGEQAHRVTLPLLQSPLTAGNGPQRRNASSAKACKLLNWSPRPASEAILASAQSLLHHCLIV